MLLVYRLALQIFESDSEEVQREWVKYTIKVDKRMEDALRYASLQPATLWSFPCRPDNMVADSHIRPAT
jgi:hypothetical protein